MTENNIWKVYNFVKDWENGKFGLHPLQECADKYLVMDDSEYTMTIEKDVLIPNGLHYLSGVGETTIEYGFCDNIDVKLFCIDGVTYGAFEDKDDGFRSYGVIQQMESNVKCEFTFAPQPVHITNQEIKHLEYETEWITKQILTMTDAVNGKEVLVVGTDNTEDYYPMAIFNYTPENLQINQGR